MNAAAIVTATDEMVHNSIESALECGLVKDGDLVVITAGVPVGMSGTTNMVRVHVMGNILLRGTGIGQKSVTGSVCIAESVRDIKTKFKPGDILVVNNIDEEAEIPMQLLWLKRAD